MRVSLAPRHAKSRPEGRLLLRNLEPETGFEPATGGLQNRYATIASLWLAKEYYKALIPRAQNHHITDTSIVLETGWLRVNSKSSPGFSRYELKD